MNILYLLSRVVTIAFFIGLCGCIPVVALSWISILKSEFSSDEDTHDEFHRTKKTS